MGYKFKYCPLPNCCELEEYDMSMTRCPVCGLRLEEEYRESPSELGLDIGGYDRDSD